MPSKIKYEVKEAMVSLSGACFWYWNSFYSFLDSNGVPKSLYNRFPKDSKYQVMRNVVEHLEESSNTEAINNLISNFFRLKKAVDRDKLDEQKASELLKEFREMVGNDPIEVEIKRRERDKARDNYSSSISDNETKRRCLEDLNSLFMTLAAGKKHTPQQRGYKLEDLFCELLQMNELEYSRPYKTPDGEQIDGHFRYEKFDYLIESKWEKGPVKQKELSIFDGKIRGKAQSTRGLFISANGFDKNAITKFSGDSPRIILMTGEDLALVLSGQVIFTDAMKAKVESIVRYGEIDYPLRNIRA